MYTLTVDDRELIVTLMQSILRSQDPKGTHLGATNVRDALHLAKQTPLDVAFLDVEMPGERNGIALGKQLKALYPKLNIVIITGHQEYALDAFALDASGYLLKPLTEEAVVHQLSVLRFHREELVASHSLRVRCFGAFEVYFNGKPLAFSYSKTKELLACLIDHKGAVCSNETLIGCLWPDQPADQHTKTRLRKCLKDLKDTFSKAGIAELIQHQERIGIGLDTSRLECDYYSSAGLRVLMKLRKQAKKALPVYNVSPEVYEIFDVTGFTDLLDVHKALRKVSEDNDIIGITTV